MYRCCLLLILVSLFSTGLSAKVLSFGLNEINDEIHAFNFDFKVKDACFGENAFIILADNGELYHAKYESLGEDVPFNAYIVPTLALQSAYSGIQEIWCSKKYDDGEHFIALKSSSDIVVRDFNSTNYRDRYPNGQMFAFDTASSNHYYAYSSGPIKHCEIGTGSSGSCANVLDIIPSILFSGGCVQDDATISKPDSSTAKDNLWFREQAYTILDVKSFGESIIILSDNGLYALIEEADESILKDTFEIPIGGCSFGESPCSLKLGVNDIDSFDISTDGTLLISSGSTLYDGSGSQENTELDGIHKVILQDSTHIKLIISDESALYALGSYKTGKRIVTFQDCTHKYSYGIGGAIKGIDFNSLQYIAYTNDHIHSGDYRSSKNVMREEVADVSIDAAAEIGPVYISKNRLVRFLDESSALSAASLDQLSVVHAGKESFAFMKTENNKLGFYKFATEKSSISVYGNHHVVDIRSSLLTIRRDSKLEYYGIGNNKYRQFGRAESKITIYDNISFKQIKETVDKFTKLEFDQISLDNIKQVIPAFQILVVITNDNKVYARGNNVNKAIDATSNKVSIEKFTLLKGLELFEVCKIYNTGHPILFIETCDGKLYQRGYLLNVVMGYDDMEARFSHPYDNNAMYEIQLDNHVKYIKGVSASDEIVMIVMNDPSPLDCIDDDCTVEDDIDLEGEEIILDNSVTIITSYVTITGGNVIVNVPPGGIPIVVDGGQLTLNSTTLTYQIDSKEVFDNIKDGDSIVIIETKNDGAIEGEFSEVIVEYSNNEGECKIVTAKAV